jgi:hypothetical protein
MSVRVSALLAALLLLTGCVNISSRDLVVPAQLAPSVESGSPTDSRIDLPVRFETVAGADRLEQLLASIDSLRKRGSMPQGTEFRSGDSQVLDTGSKTAEDLLLEPAVRDVVAAMVEARRASEGGAATKSAISVTALFKLGHALGSARRSMLDDVIAGDVRAFSGLTVSAGRKLLAGPPDPTRKPSFAFVLATYYKALANGKYVDRRGQQLAKLKYSDGIGNETLGELVTVFFEALCDHALFDDLPLYYQREAGTVELTPMYHPVVRRPDGSYTVDNSAELVQDLGGYDDPRPALVSPAFFQRRLKPGGKTYLLTDGKVPTAVAAKIVREVDLAGNPDGVTEEQLRAIRTVSNFAGQRAKGASSLVFGFLGKIDVSFVLGAGFSVGDNKTLQELVAAVAEVASRRLSEWAAYSVAHRSNQQDPAEIRDPQATFWKRLNGIPDSIQEP